MPKNNRGVGHVQWIGMLLLTAVGCGFVMESEDPDVASLAQASESPLGPRQDCLDECYRQYSYGYEICQMTPGNWACYMLLSQDYQFCIGTCPAECDPYLAECQSSCYTLPNPDDQSTCLRWCYADHCE